MKASRETAQTNPSGRHMGGGGRERILPDYAAGSTPLQPPSMQYESGFFHVASCHFLRDWMAVFKTAELIANDITLPIKLGRFLEYWV